RCTAAPSSGACTCTPGGWRFRIFRGSEPAMADPVRPRDAKDVEAAVQWALAEGKTVEIVGHGSKRAIGRPPQTDVTLDLSTPTRVTPYEPPELVRPAKAGTPLAEIEALLAANGQQLAFEPMDYAGIIGGVAGRGTIGGALAANVSGPRRIKAGAGRDHFLGFHAVSGRGETFKSGGRGVKNVTGYDLCKLIAGSWGTLAAMTEVTIKVLPRPATEQELLILGLEPARAGAGGRGHDLRHGVVRRRVGRRAPAGGGRRPHRGGRDRGRRRHRVAARGVFALGRRAHAHAQGADEAVRRARDGRGAALARV